MPHVTTIIQRWLGNRPFVLIELDAERTGPGEDDFEIKMDMTFGGGVSKSGALGVLTTMLEQQEGFEVKVPEGFDPDAED